MWQGSTAATCLIRHAGAGNGHLFPLAPMPQTIRTPLHPLLALLLTLLLLGSCVSLPANIRPVDGFEVDRYLGRWYEIARLDHSFERGLSHVTADYSLRDDGGVRVVNRGYDQKRGLWKEAEGRAYFVEKQDQGFLKVSFFGPFYGAYAVCDLDRQSYRYALVCGPSTSYLWILARSPQLDGDTVRLLVERARALGYDTNALIFVDHRSPVLDDAPAAGKR